MQDPAPMSNPTPSQTDPGPVLSLDHLSSARDLASVLACARDLQRNAQAGEVQALLRGKKLGLFCEDDTTPEAKLFRLSGAGLGAHVAHIRPSLSDLTTPLEVQHTANMLGRLYDAVECQGMSPLCVRLIRREAGIPVYDAIGAQEHAITALCGLLDRADSEADRRCFVVQAALLQTIGGL